MSHSGYNGHELHIEFLQNVEIGFCFYQFGGKIETINGMRRLHLSRIYFDLEWNTGFLDGTSFDEILEIGAVKVDANGIKQDSFQQLIRPIYYRRMNPYIQKIVPFTMDDLKLAPPFKTVVRSFFDWCGENATLIAWSTNDTGVLEKNLLRAGIKIPDGFHSYDLQAAYSFLTEHSIHSYSLKAAVDAMELPAPEEQTFHDAYYDALYTAAIGRRLLEIYRKFPTEETLLAFRATQCKPKKEKLTLKYSVKKAVHSPQNYTFPCPVCGNILRLRNWYCIDEEHFIGKASCSCKSTYYPQLFCDNFRQNRCDQHFSLWGEKHQPSVLAYEGAREKDFEIKLYSRGRKEQKPCASQNS